MYMTMKIDDIQIPKYYKRTPPQEKKFNKHLEYYIEHGTFKHNIVVTQKGLLLDGYCNYMIALEYGMDSVECEINTKRLKRNVSSRNRTINNRTYKRNVLYERQNGKCAICGKQLQIYCSKRNDYLTFDHILPVSRGGSNALMNLQGVCMECNSRKQDDLILDFIEEG